VPPCLQAEQKHVSAWPGLPVSGLRESKKSTLSHQVHLSVKYGHASPAEQRPSESTFPPWQTGYSIGHTSQPQSTPAPVKQQKNARKLN
jgi:hypothetical protein